VAGLPVSLADHFAYDDPVDGSRAEAQGIRVVMGDAARIILRLSGTGTQGATLRLYLERHETDATQLNRQPAEVLAPLAAAAEQLGRISELTGRKAPSLVT
jgi:phosphoglucomutase